jgi:hypothetical protein
LAFLSRFQIAKVKLAGGPYFFWANAERQEERGVFYSPLDKWQRPALAGWIITTQPGVDDG